MSDEMSRRGFLADSTTKAIGLAAASGVIRGSSGAMAPDEASFVGNWKNTHDRAWIGPEYWANPLQDWRVASGRLECIKPAPDRNVHLLTRSLGEGPGGFQVSVRVGRIGGKLGEGGGSFGFRVGIQGPLKEYRNSLIFGTGLEAGVTSGGAPFLGGSPSTRVKVDLSGDSVVLRLAADRKGDVYELTFSVLEPGTDRILGTSSRDDVAPEQLVGNVALVANFPAALGGRTAPGSSVAKAKKAAPPPGSLGAFWFDDWRVGGAKVEAHDDRAFGPILFSQYTLSRKTLKLTAQMPPIGDQDSRAVRLQVRKGGRWADIAEAAIHPEARTATFRVEGWDDSRDTPYRLAYDLTFQGMPTQERDWTGTIRRDPVDAPTLTVADVSCNAHYAFPNVGFVARMAGLDPDLLAFTGDQFYEPSGGYSVQRAPLQPSILDLLRKWYLHGWTWRELTRDRPSVSIPDDHDVFQGNIWGEAGDGRRATQEMGGYEMPVEWINVVHRTQTSHHPDPFDPTPAHRGVSVYYGPMTYGRVSFAIIADRQFKSGPEGKVPPTGGRGDHVVDPRYDLKAADLPGLELLGDRQMAFLRAWAADWKGADLKAVISQTISTAMATTHGPDRERLRADFDTNAWPQSARNAALREIRKGFAFHIAGDQHLAAVVRYGVDAPGDAGAAFAGPAVNNLYPRWWEPEEPGRDRPAGADPTLGDFLDNFGHPLTVLAVANPGRAFRKGVLEAERDKGSGLGIVRFDKRDRTITVECWPFLADPKQPGTQFPGWPVTVSLLDNYGRKPSGHLPTLDVEGVESPVIQVIEEATGEVVYTLRTPSRRFRPFVFAGGKHTVVVGDPETGRSKELRGLAPRPDDGEVLRVIVGTIGTSLPLFRPKMGRPLTDGA